MPADWDGVDSLIRELGAIRAAADSTRAAQTASEAVEAAIAAAALAIGDTIGVPRNSDALSHAHQTIASARELVASLALEIERASPPPHPEHDRDPD